MIIDTSALMAVLRAEPEAEICARAIESAAESHDGQRAATTTTSHKGPHAP